MSRSVLITGAGGGIGSALAHTYRNAGWRVIGADIKRDHLENCHASIEVDLIQLARQDDVLETFRRQVLEELQEGRLDALVNNAATQRLSGLEYINKDDWQSSLDINLTAPLRLVQSLLPNLKLASGVVVNIGSVHARATKPEFIAYSTTKAALHGLTRALAVDLGPAVRVVCLAPAATATPMLEAGFIGRPAEFSALEECHPLGRVARPEEVAEAALFLTSPEAKFMTGSTLWLDGGVMSRLHDPV